jgi:hypothetical protein
MMELENIDGEIYMGNLIEWLLDYEIENDIEMRMNFYFRHNHWVSLNRKQYSVGRGFQKSHCYLANKHSKKERETKKILQNYQPQKSLKNF